MVRHAASCTTAVGTDNLASLETIGKLLRGHMRDNLRDSLQRVSDALKATMRRQDLLRAEPDIEAVAEAGGIASRPGPREAVKSELTVALREAIKRSVPVRLKHWTATAKRPSRGHEVEPLGLLYATGRRHLVDRSRHHGGVHLFRLGRISTRCSQLMAR